MANVLREQRRCVGCHYRRTGNELHDPEAGQLSGVLSPSGRHLITISRPDTDPFNLGTARVWDVNWTARQITHRPGIPEIAGVIGITFSPDGAYFLTVHRGPFQTTPQIWDLATGNRITNLVGHEAPVNSAAYSHTGRFIATTDEQGTIKVWDTANYDLLFSLKERSVDVRPEYAIFSPDERYLLSIGDDGVVRQYLTQIGELMSIAKGQLRRGLTTSERATYLGEPLPAPISDLTIHRGATRHMSTANSNIRFQTPPETWRSVVSASPRLMGDFKTWPIL